MDQDTQDTITIALIKPVKLGELTYGLLSLEEPDAEQLMQAQAAGGPIAQLVTLISLVGKIPMAAAKKLKQRDLEACGDFFGRFSGGGLPSSLPSETPSPT